jgi:hypothetical protein
MDSIISSEFLSAQLKAVKIWLGSRSRGEVGRKAGRFNLVWRILWEQREGPLLFIYLF